MGFFVGARWENEGDVVHQRVFPTMASATKRSKIPSFCLTTPKYQKAGLPSERLPFFSKGTTMETLNCSGTNRCKRARIGKPLMGQKMGHLSSRERGYGSGTNGATPVIPPSAASTSSCAKCRATTSSPGAKAARPCRTTSRCSAPSATNGRAGRWRSGARRNSRSGRNDGRKRRGQEKSARCGTVFGCPSFPSPRREQKEEVPADGPRRQKGCSRAAPR